MTGLNLESFLHLLRADLGVWAVLGVLAGVLVLLTWTSWGSRRALRKCLVLSMTAHLGLALYGSTFLIVLLALQPEADDASTRASIRQIRISPWSEEEPEGGESAVGRGDGRPMTRVMPWDRPRETMALADPKVEPPRPAADIAAASAIVRPAGSTALAAELTAPEVKPPDPPNPESRPEPEGPAAPSAPPTEATPVDPAEVARPVVAGRDDATPDDRAVDHGDHRIRPERAPTSSPEAVRASPSPADLPGAATAVPALKAPEPGAPEAVAARPGAPPPSSPALITPAAADPARDVAPPAVNAANPSPAPSDPAPPDHDLRALVRRPEGELRGLPDSRATGTPGRVVVPSPSPSPRSPIALAPAPPRGTAMPIAAPSSIPGSGPGSGHDPGAGASSVAAEPFDARNAPEVVKRPAAAPPPEPSLPEAEVRLRSRPDRGAGAGADPGVPRRSAEATSPIALSRVLPGGFPRLPEVRGTTGGRPLSDVPEVYRSRLDPNRSALAQRAGASAASEQAVERALDWLARHQDTDGRWDGATAKYDDGTPVKGDDDYTIHCPAGETCFGECIYWEADTALTGLALLAYLGSGYTQADGKYAETVGKGLDFLLLQQRPDGDLRGRSRAVGMYCHAMATLALCEAYALTGDERLRDPVERAIGFLVASRARDGLAWRYAPAAPVGDTSILGWVVLALKSAKVVGIPVSVPVQEGTLTWLNKVASGPANGLARYQPNEPVTATMTAEAWVCRQFLGVGGPGPASTEAAGYLLERGPARDPYNLYYWYYGTLAMYQHGGDAWTRWNAEVRDQIVRRQGVSGHKAGSWDPDESIYGVKGGRIYCTALATLTLEVYYRFLRLYDDPKLPSPGVVGGGATTTATPRRADVPPTSTSTRPRLRPRDGRAP